LAKVAVVGLGYVGITTSLGLASLGHTVLGIDIDEVKVANLQSGALPIYEPGLEDLLKREISSGSLVLSSSFESVDSSLEFVFVCVATPSSKTGQADLSFVEAALESLAPRLNPGAIIVMKSTMPVGSCKKFAEDLKPYNLKVASNPEFLSEGKALFDFQAPSRIVVGVESEETGKAVMELYKQIDAPRILCSLTSAEAIKHASNSFLSVKLSFVNEVAELCELSGADVSEVTLGMSLDPRIGEQFLRPGPGWGGSCFPKDSLELVSTVQALGGRMPTLEAAIQSNSRTISRVTDVLRESLGGDLSGKRVAIWGLAFKANTDDTRESPAVKVAESIIQEGGLVFAYDPIAKPGKDSRISIGKSPLEVCSGSNALVVLTEWKEFGLVEASSVKAVMAEDPTIFDTRGILPFEVWSREFEKFHVVGKQK
jgi:UDPglucose 6-dehydrogenase